MKSFIWWAMVGAWITVGLSRAAEIPRVSAVDAQPLAAQVRRLLEAAGALGVALSPADRDALTAAIRGAPADVADRVQDILDPKCLYVVHVNPEMRVKVATGPAKAELDEGGWRVFLVKVLNEAGTTAPLRAVSPNARRLHESPPEDVPDRWLDLEMFDKPPMTPTLGGLGLEYRWIQLYSRDAGRRDARMSFDVGQGTQDIGFRNDVDRLFECRPATPVTLEVLDETGQPTVGSFLVRDAQGRVYPAQSKRLAPDFSFHPQVYRADGEKIPLPPGNYSFQFMRGPESIPKTEWVSVDRDPVTVRFKAERWIDPSRWGWWSGDHHIHAAGCAHYTKPSEGVHAPDMFRHCVGEDLKIGANLTWGPCFDYQKKFFTGKIDKVSRYPYLLRYDVEVSGFGSHQSGHLCLLRLEDQMPPGGDSKNHWPTLGLNTLRWAKKQGAVCGPAHSGWGLQVETSELPNLVVPPFDGIGANEYIVDVTHTVPGPDGKPVPAVDFISTVDTPYVWELNIWYHTLNCGFRTRISGETDFPCIYGERVGLGRSYVHLEGPLEYDAWCEGIRAGRNYVGDGRSHLLDFRVNDVEVGKGSGECRLEAPGTVAVSARVAALLPQEPDNALRSRKYSDQPYWHVERARIGRGREVPVEVLVNGRPVAKRNLLADGTLHDLKFEVAIERSSWVALRILPSSHTNPIWVTVGGKPVRASRASADWCLQGVERCWQNKERFIAAAEREDALAAYEHARATYRRLKTEAEAD